MSETVEPILNDLDRATTREIALVDWEERLTKSGLSMEAGVNRRRLFYGYNDHFRAPQEISIGIQPLKRAKKPTGRQIAKAKVWQTPLPSTDPPEWGYVGGYDSEARRVKVNPTLLHHLRITEEKNGARVAVRSRNHKSTT